MPFADVLGNLGDAIAGVDREGAYIKGRGIRLDQDKTVADTEAAMELAKERRLNAEINQQIKEARDRFGAAAAAPDYDPGATNIGDVVLGNLGSNFSGAMTGRNEGQEYNLNETIATPEGEMLGDTIVTDALRQAALDARAPSAAVAMRRPRPPGTPIPVADDDGGTILVNPDGTPFTIETPTGPRPARPGARPAAPRADPGPTNQQRNFTWLTEELGVAEEAALRISTNTEADPVAVYEQARDAVLRAFGTEEEADAAGREAVAAIATLEPNLIPDVEVEPELEAEAGDDYAEGEKLVNPQTGQTIVLRAGVWVDAETGVPVQ